MKRHLALLLVLVTLIGLVACGKKPAETTLPTTAPGTEATTEPTTAPTTEPTTVPTTEPAATVSLGGVDLTGMTLEQAAQALNEAAAAYKLALSVNGTRLTVSAEELELALDQEALAKYLEAVQNGTELPDKLFTYSGSKLRSLISDKLNTAPKNATVSYNSSKKQFAAAAGANGTEVDAAAAESAAAAAIGMLEPSVQVKADVKKIAPEYTVDSEKVKSAVNTANGYLKVNLSYTYSPEGGASSTVALSTADLASFVSISESMGVSISKSKIESYVSRMSDKHSGSDYKASFQTTGGSTIGLTVTYYGQRINKSAMADDLYKCVTEGISGTRTAPYSAKSSKPYGGNYVEVNLSSQKLWVYKNGEQVVSTSLVSGSVAEGHRTPTGVYSIYSKQTDRYLTGADYRSFVHYWMPFLGGYGLHDASWRSSFGGDIYLYDGSHGCVNLPSSAAKKVYNNVSVGTKVILYGGKSEVPDLEQKLTGTTSYTVNQGDKSFKLDVKAKYSKGASITYVSSDLNVVTVSANGTVTIKNPGTATITVTAAPFEFYTGAELKITVTVLASGETQPTEPKPTEPKPTEPQPTEPKPTEPKPTEPKPTEPQPTEPKPTEPKPTEPKPTEPAPTEPKPTEPAPTEPAPTEPAPTEPAPTEPVAEEPAE
ncbi:MAG: L,D-transpeptidase family protein [Oscillospiraceae bacterium]|nr:L,D-transpeptidase family protein [Oscillospiraceae bacterium]